MVELKNELFYVEAEGTLLKSLKHRDDPYTMNWVEGAVPWGSVMAPKGISVNVTRDFTDAGTLRESYVFTNDSAFPVFTCLGDIGVRAPFNDSYHEAAVCVKNRCHTHLWCGGTSSYVMCLRMGGETPHLGLVLTRGSLEAYSVERDLTLQSNDRGDFVLHPAPLRLEPGETYTLEWELFWHNGKDDFYQRLRAYPSYIEIQAEHFVIFEGEETGLTIVRREGQPDMQVTPALLTPLHPGERRYCTTGEGVNAWCRILTLPPLMELAEARCNFIVAKQQYHQPGSSLDGAYLIYDNEEAHLFYTHRNDDNGGRERVGMGTLIARYLRLVDKLAPDIEASLKQYAAYVLRELFDPETGVVFNDIKRSTDCYRFYNYPWFVRFFMELYGLWKDAAYLRYAYKTMNAFYEKGGHTFYAIGVPMAELLPLLESENLPTGKETLKNQFMRHADTILKNGMNYPAHEVKYEQSIVAPAADILFQAYTIFRDEKYLDGAKQQLAILSLFNGQQPDSCLYETAIRHWDGYWFGKRRLYGDTFPHYWSALTGMAYSLYSKAGGGESARKVAEASIRGALGLFMPDGSATCARLYPLKVNGEWASYLDPWANDQDWALFFALDFFRGRNVCTD